MVLIEQRLACMILDVSDRTLRRRRQGVMTPDHQEGKACRYALADVLETLQTGDYRPHLRNTGPVFEEYCELLQAAAEQGGGAFTDLGLFCMEQLDEPAQAHLWFKEGAHAGHPDSMAFLSESFRKGEGCAPNTEQADFWLARAARRGHGIAKAQWDAAKNGAPLSP